MDPRRDEDQHWWDPDPRQRQRNKELDDQIDRIVNGYPMETPRRRKADDDMNPWIKLALQVGVPAVIALFLVQQLAAKFDAKLDVNMDMLREHTKVTEAVVQRVTRQELYLDRLVSLTYAQCYNSAKSTAERSMCQQAATK